jgi:hypothetical protein
MYNKNNQMIDNTKDIRRLPSITFTIVPCCCIHLRKRRATYRACYLLHTYIRVNNVRLSVFRLPRRFLCAKLQKRHADAVKTQFKGAVSQTTAGYACVSNDSKSS